MSNQAASPLVVEGSNVPQQSQQNDHAQQQIITQSHPTQVYPQQNTLQPPPPPPPSTSETWALPPGWKLVHSPRDGRVYYWEMATGRTSWSHPHAPGVTILPNPNNTMSTTPKSLQSQGRFPPPPPQDDRFNRRTALLDTPANATRRPDSHQCCAAASLVCCCPMGVCAMYHSFNVDKFWKQGRYGDAVNSSKQAYKYAWYGCVIGGIVFIVWLARRDQWEMPSFDFDWGDR